MQTAVEAHSRTSSTTRLIELRNDGQAARGPAPRRPHQVRPRDDARRSAPAPGIENYSRHLDGREPGESPTRLIDYFSTARATSRHGSDHRRDPRDDPADSRRCTTATAAARRCSSNTASACRAPGQPAAAVRGVRAAVARTWCSSPRRPADYELERCGGEVVEQVIRPTGLVDPADRGPPGARAGRRPARLGDARARGAAASERWSPR